MTERVVLTLSDDAVQRLHHLEQISPRVSRAEIVEVGLVALEQETQVLARLRESEVVWRKPR
jgi:DNA-binding TFAR19-related protein (PDSD5 family)